MDFVSISYFFFSSADHYRVRGKNAIAVSIYRHDRIFKIGIHIYLRPWMMYALEGADRVRRMTVFRPSFPPSSVKRTPRSVSYAYVVLVRMYVRT